MKTSFHMLPTVTKGLQSSKLLSEDRRSPFLDSTPASHFRRKHHLLSSGPALHA